MPLLTAGFQMYSVVSLLHKKLIVAGIEVVCLPIRNLVVCTFLPYEMGVMLVKMNKKLQDMCSQNFYWSQHNQCQFVVSCTFIFIFVTLFRITCTTEERRITTAE